MKAKNILKSFLCYVFSITLIINVGLIIPTYADVNIPDGRDDEFGENNIVFYNPKCPPKTKPGPVSSDDILIIGDSITEGSKTQLQKKLPNATIISQVGKQLGGSDSSNPTGIEVLKQRAMFLQA